MPERRIRILFLIDELIAGGTEKQLILLAESLDRTYFDPIIGVFHRNTYQADLKLSTPIVEFNWSGQPLLKNFSLLLRLKQYFQKEKIDIVQTHLIEATIYGAWAVRLSKKRPILVATRRNLYHWIRDEPIRYLLYRYSVNWTDIVLINSHSALAKCKELEKIPSSKIQLIQNGVKIRKSDSFSPESAKQRIGLAGAFPVIGVVGNWRPVKGLLSFLAAAAMVIKEIPSAHFVLVGKGPQECELKSYVDGLNLSGSVTFLKNEKNISAAVSSFDIAVQPSLSESFSNALVEYMAASLPIVASRVGDAEMVITNGREGILVDPGNPEKFSKAILELCHNRDKAIRMGQAARKKVEGNWAIEKIVGIHQRFYLGLIEKKIRKI